MRFCAALMDLVAKRMGGVPGPVTGLRGPRLMELKKDRRRDSLSREARALGFNTSQNPLTYLRFLTLSPLDIVPVFPHFSCTYVTMDLLVST